MHRQSALASISAARRALSSKLSVTDGDVVVAMANDHPESIRRDRARLLDQRLQLSRGGTFQRRDAWRAIPWHTHRGRSGRVSAPQRWTFTQTDRRDRRIEAGVEGTAYKAKTRLPGANTRLI